MIRQAMMSVKQKIREDKHTEAMRRDEKIEHDDKRKEMR
jgi:hypothetical protein